MFNELKLQYYSSQTDNKIIFHRKSEGLIANIPLFAKFSITAINDTDNFIRYNNNYN